MYNWARLANRRDENKTKKDLEDIFSAISLVDENMAMVKLPKYVVDHLDDDTADADGERRTIDINFVPGEDRRGCVMH